MNLRRTRAVARKEFLHILRDPRSLALALAVPLFLLLLFGFGLTLDVDRIPALVYDSDHTPASRDLIARFDGSRYFTVTGYVDNYKAIEESIDRDQALLAVVIPRGFARELAAGRRPAVQLIFDGSDSNTASIARGYAQSLLEGYSFNERAGAIQRKGGIEFNAPVAPELRALYNSQLESKNYIVPGLIAVILMIIAALITSLTIAREWETGTMEELLSTPLRPSELVLGKMAAFFTLGFVDVLTSITVGVLVFHVPLRGSPLLLIVTSSIFLFGAMSLGLLVSALTRSQLLAYQIGMITSFLPAFLLSGFVYSINNMPQAIQVMTHIVSARYFVTILKGIYLKGVGLEVLWGEVLFLIGFSAVMFLITTKKMRQKVA